MKLHNRNTKQKDDIVPLNGKKFLVYTCGPTVYDYQHLGNYATQLRYDTLIRTIKYATPFDVKHVMNITDVGHLVSDADEGADKLDKKAKEENKTAWEIADFYIADYKKWLKKLNILQPDKLIRATDYINEQIDLVKRLENKGYTYKIDDGIYFDTSKFEEYANFAKLDLDGLKEGERIGVNPQKRNPSDFALWKLSPTDCKRDMDWESPWGLGFPGWHAECSAMAFAELGESIDIHAGGIDLIPVHHTNEIAQSECASGKKFSNHWLHSNFLNIKGEKLAKSAGNSILPLDILEKRIDILAFRVMILQAKYSSEADFTWESLTNSAKCLNLFKNLSVLRFDSQANSEVNVDFKALMKELKEYLNDDLNTPKVIAKLYELSDILSDGVSKPQKGDFIELLEFLDNVLGLRLLEDNDIPKNTLEKIKARESFKKNKDYDEADKIRDELLDEGVSIRDSSTGTIWSIAF